MEKIKKYYDILSEYCKIKENAKSMMEKGKEAIVKITDTVIENKVSEAEGL